MRITGGAWRGVPRGGAGGAASASLSSFSRALLLSSRALLRSSSLRLRSSSSFFACSSISLLLFSLAALLLSAEDSTAPTEATEREAADVPLVDDTAVAEPTLAEAARRRSSLLLFLSSSAFLASSSIFRCLSALSLLLFSLLSSSIAITLLVSCSIALLLSSLFLLTPAPDHRRNPRPLTASSWLTLSLTLSSSMTNPECPSLS
eukprot:CAMPEP_0114623908 /NCGR_PEP_ID=MMETSP0168-20121206/10494_1 /TAXON_ID=95228 ORGANISM="Vannella sp., Strain DIVA3 517/6/12" /NCGR_SAMPLE_ID=MMETSP0168 /ASSEMBLY_ACC=CAM_ASM_000044 /LENGTH=204 /DNA_ID=CAMNT_0001835167 /DNA_START=134 /DNA_END=744 /DNA_ORIENTATION=+